MNDDRSIGAWSELKRRPTPQFLDDSESLPQTDRLRDLNNPAKRNVLKLKKNTNYQPIRKKV